LAEIAGDKTFALADRPDPGAGPGVSVALDVGDGSLTADGDSTLEVIVRVLDTGGRQSAWCGELTARVTGPARVRSFDGRGTVWVADGIGRTFISRLTGMYSNIRLEVGGDKLTHGTIELEVE
jgi:hypothetical protein